MVVYSGPFFKCLHAEKHYEASSKEEARKKACVDCLPSDANVRLTDEDTWEVNCENDEELQ